MNFVLLDNMSKTFETDVGGLFEEKKTKKI